MVCDPLYTACMEDAVDVWVMWLLIICGVIFVVTLIIALVRCMKDKKKRKNHPRPPPRVQSPVYFVPAQTQQQTVPVGWNVQVKEYGNGQPTYNQVYVQNAPPPYTTTYVTNVGRM